MYGMVEMAKGASSTSASDEDGLSPPRIKASPIGDDDGGCATCRPLAFSATSNARGNARKRGSIVGATQGTVGEWEAPGDDWSVGVFRLSTLAGGCGPGNSIGRVQLMLAPAGGKGRFAAGRSKLALGERAPGERDCHIDVTTSCHRRRPRKKSGTLNHAARAAYGLPGSLLGGRVYVPKYCYLSTYM